MESINGNDVLLHDLSVAHPSHIPPPPPPLREKNKRPQLSCNPCRARKVKCDRIQPCSACSLHQIADICHYDLSESERQPILQAEALKEKDRTIVALKEEIAVLRGADQKGELDDRGGQSQKLRLPPRTPRKSNNGNDQIRNREQDQDLSAFAENGLVHMADDFNHLSFGRAPDDTNRALRHEFDVFAYQTVNAYPFPTLWNANDDISSLIRLLPAEQELFFYRESFQRRSALFSFPMVPDELTEVEVHQFLDNIEQNASNRPDQLALLFAALALGLHDGVFDKLGEKWATGSMEIESRKGDIYVAAAMQCLRAASFTSRPSLLVIQTLMMMAPCLTYSGKYLDASALFALTVRLAQSINLYRDPAQLNVACTAKENSTRRTLWWWMLYMDQQYSTTLGKPLAISTVGDCPSPDPLLPGPAWQSISNHIVQFTLIARDILSVPVVHNEIIDHGTDKLLLLQKSLHHVARFDSSWLHHDKALVGWPLDVQAAILHAKVHNLITSLNRRRTEYGIHTLDNSVMPPSLSQNNTDIDGTIRGRPRVLESCRGLLQSFEFFHSRLKAGLVSWSMGQMAFNAAMLLTLSMLETGETLDLLPVQHAYSTFLEMNKLGIHKLAGAAVERLGKLMKEFGTDDSANEKVMGWGGMLLLEEAGWQKSVSEDSRSITGRTSRSPMTKVNSRPSPRPKTTSQRRRQSRRATTFRDSGVTKSRRNSLSKGHRNLADRRFSDSIAPKSAYRRRLNKSIPELSLLTTLSDQNIFSPATTPAIKSESLFQPSNTSFDTLSHSPFTLGEHGTLDAQVMNNLSNTDVSTFQLNPQHHNFATDTPRQSSPIQQEDSSAQAHRHRLSGLSDVHLSHPVHSLSTDRSQQQQQQQQQAPHFDFSTTSTPYSSEFFDNNSLHAVGSSAFDDNHLNFEHQPFTSAPSFSISSEAHAFPGGPF